LQLKSNVAAGRSLLVDLAMEAKERGFGLIARRAQEALAATNVITENETAQ